MPRGRKPSAGAASCLSLGKKTIDDFVGSSVAADCEKIAHAARIRAVEPAVVASPGPPV